MTAAMRAVAMTTVRFLTQPIQTSSCLLGTLVINGLEELQDLQEQNGGHFGFLPTTTYAHTFESDTPPVSFIDLQRRQKH